MSLRGVRMTPGGTTYRGTLTNRTGAVVTLPGYELGAAASAVALRIRGFDTLLVSRPLPIRTYGSGERNDIVLKPGEAYEFYFRHPVVMEVVGSSARPKSGVYFSRWELLAPVGANLPESSRAIYPSAADVSVTVVDE